MTERTRRDLGVIAAVVAAIMVIACISCGPSPPPKTTTKKSDVETAIDRGVAYLVASQNKDGSWGSPASNLYDIYAPFPGSYYAFGVASTALAASALIDVGEGRPGADAALARATDYLLAHHVVKRATSDTIYNTWTHAYSLEFFARCMAREKDDARRASFAEAAAQDVDRLVRYEFVDGGWGYYDFDFGTQRPAHGATSFSTASCLLALKAGAERGVDVPKRLVTRGTALLEHCRGPVGIFSYDFRLRQKPSYGVNHVQGSLARTPACLLALDAWGKGRPLSEARAALDNLEKQGHFLQIARKYPKPHEAWYQNSGYFCFYGYHYAARLTKLLPEAERAPRFAKIAKYLVSTQEKDGSFWDYQLYGYHKAYGTGYVLQTLANCR